MHIVYFLLSLLIIVYFLNFCISFFDATIFWWIKMYINNKNDQRQRVMRESTVNAIITVVENLKRTNSR